MQKNLAAKFRTEPPTIITINSISSWTYTAQVHELMPFMLHAIMRVSPL